MKTTLYEQIEALEGSFDPNKVVVTWKNKTFQVYPWVKPIIFSSIQTGGTKPPASKGARFQLKQLLSGRKYKYTDVTSLIFSNSLERRLIDDKVIDKLFEELASEKALKPIKTVETKFEANFYPLEEYENSMVYSRSSFYLKEQLLVRGKLRNLEVSWPQELLDFLAANELELDLTGVVRRHIAQYFIMRDYLKRHKRLKYVFLSVHYTNFGLVNACKDLGIPVVEMQHGVINEQHYGYSYAYTPTDDQFPNYLLTFGERDETFINRSHLHAHTKARAIGSYVLERYQNRGVEMVPGTVAISGQDCQTGQEVIADFIALAEKNKDLHFYFKPRRTDIAWYKDRFVFPENWTFEEKRDIYQLILECEIHATAYSSCALEAPTLGRRNLLFNHNGKARNYYHDKLEEGLMNKYSDSFEELHQQLSVLLAEDPSQSDIKESNAANIKPHYQDNIHTFIREILTK